MYFQINLVLRLDDPPVHISVNKNGQTLAIDELGKVFVFAMDIKDQIKPSSAISTITVLDDKSIVPILDAVFVDSERIDIVWGTRIKPMFETVLILDSNGNTIPIINLDRKVSFLLAKESFQTMSKTQDYKEADSIPDTFETLALAIKPVDSQVEAPKRPTAASLNVMLSQAIHSGDQTLLEKCLSQKDIKVVNLTVSRIPPSQAQPLLILLLDKLKKSPARLSSLIGWIKSVFHNHSAYLMSTPLLDRLSELYQVLDQRVSTNKKLSKLSGRLDLLASGIEKRGKTIEDDEDALIYNEEDDSEEEVDGEIADYEIEDEEQSENDSSEEEESSEESDDDDEDDEKMASGSDEE